MVFAAITHTSWQKETTQINLTSIKEAMSSFPMIERQYFDDLVNLCHNNSNYFVEAGLLRVINEQGKDLVADFWILLWAVDFRGRLFHILVERNPEYGGKGAIVAVGPPEFLEFISSMKKNAILPTLTLLNSPEKMKSVGVLVSQPPKYAEVQKDRLKSMNFARFKGWIDDLKAAPNVSGQWFPATGATKCPLCNAGMIPMGNYQVAFGQLVCPQCGYAIRKGKS
jgi:hypothetical protein